MKKININKNNIDKVLAELVQLIDFENSTITESENKYPFRTLTEKKIDTTLLRNIINVHLINHNYLNVYNTSSYIEFKIEKENSYYQIILQKI
ncbi:MAG: hypothetical protein ACRC0G_01620 [Fusobacteriaceae bacterium]